MDEPCAAPQPRHLRLLIPLRQRRTAFSSIDTDETESVHPHFSFLSKSMRSAFTGLKLQVRAAGALPDPLPRKRDVRLRQRSEPRRLHQRACNFLCPLRGQQQSQRWGQVRGAQRSSHHAFSRLTSSSSSGVKSFLMLKRVRISSGVLPLISSATVLHVRSRRDLMSR